MREQKNAPAMLARIAGANAFTTYLGRMEARMIVP